MLRAYVEPNQGLGVWGLGFRVRMRNFGVWAFRALAGSVRAWGLERGDSTEGWSFREILL